MGLRRNASIWQDVAVCTIVQPQVAARLIVVIRYAYAARRKHHATGSLEHYISGTFNIELENLRNSVLTMGGEVESMVMLKAVKHNHAAGKSGVERLKN